MKQPAKRKHYTRWLLLTVVRFATLYLASWLLLLIISGAITYTINIYNNLTGALIANTADNIFDQLIFILKIVLRNEGSPTLRYGILAIISLISMYVTEVLLAKYSTIREKMLKLFVYVVTTMTVLLLGSLLSTISPNAPTNSGFNLFILFYIWFRSGTFLVFYIGLYCLAESIIILNPDIYDDYNTLVN